MSYRKEHFVRLGETAHILNTGLDWKKFYSFRTLLPPLECRLAPAYQDATAQAHGEHLARVLFSPGRFYLFSEASGAARVWRWL